mgnify:CR=1 FL=1
MGSAVNKIALIVITLIMPFIGYNQSVFNKAFDESNTANHTANALEVNKQYYFTQKTFKNGGAHIEAVKLDSLGVVLLKSDVVSTNPVILGFYKDEFYFIDKQRYRLIDTFSYVSPVFNNSMRFVAKKGTLGRCLEEDPAQLISITSFASFLRDFDSISPYYFEKYKLNRVSNRESRFNKKLPQGRYLKLDGGKFGVYDTAWTLILPIKYDFIYPYSADVFVAKNEGKKGLISLDTIVFPLDNTELERLRSENDSLFMFTKGNRTNYLINEKGEIQRGRLDGFSAVIFQHEFRHLMNGTYLDYANHFLPKDVLDQKIKTGEIPFFELAKDTLPLLIDGYQLGKTLEDY